METTECPKCGMENAFFNTVCYECPDCDFEWGDIDDEDNDDLEDEKQKEIDIDNFD